MFRQAEGIVDFASRRVRFVLQHIPIDVDDLVQLRILRLSNHECVTLQIVHLRTAHGDDIDSSRKHVRGRCSGRKVGLNNRSIETRAAIRVIVTLQHKINTMLVEQRLPDRS